MTCFFCEDPRCDADAVHEDGDGLTDWIATARAMDRCRVRLAERVLRQVVQLRDRALRAEAEVAAHMGDESALDAFLPAGWRGRFHAGSREMEWRRNAGEFHADVDLRGNWRVMNNQVYRVASNTPDGGILAAINEADLALEAAELSLRSKP